METAPRPSDDEHVDDYVLRGQRTDLTIAPWDRAVGARLAATMVEQRNAGKEPAPQHLHYRGSAGQSFGAFLTEGMTLELHGDANDYVGKSMEAGRIIVHGAGTAQEPAIGNACFYGARGGDAYIHGRAGERFGVRNSGATIVCEGAGDHACEYMTAGLAVILGPTGRNLASGMSGGLAFVLGAAPDELQLGPAEISVVRCTGDDPDLQALHAAITAHAELTGSKSAQALLASWPGSCTRFLKIVPELQVRTAAHDAAAAKT